MRRIPNQILIIGGDHHNTLAVVRCLGKAKCDIRILVHGSENDVSQIRIAHSKYAKGKVECCEENSNKVIDWIMKREYNDYPSILFPCSDFAAHAIDNCKELSEHNFILPGFQGEQGKVVQLMDKYEQKRFADTYGFPMAQTWQIEQERGQFSAPENIVFPCIVKPQLSAEGSKSDISICADAEELKDVLISFAEKAYKSIVIQQFLVKEYEQCAFGCVIGQAPFFSGGIINKLRENPPEGGGSLSYAQFLKKSDFVGSLAADILKLLHQNGYRGMFDIELLVCKDQTYLNEINFRHSGNGYAMVRNGVKAPLYYCMDAAGLGIPSSAKLYPERETYHMDELSDVIHVIKHRISIRVWLKDILQTKAFAKWWIGDISGSIVWFWPYIRLISNKIKSVLLK